MVSEPPINQREARPHPKKGVATAVTDPQKGVPIVMTVFTRQDLRKSHLPSGSEGTSYLVV